MIQPFASRWLLFVCGISLACCFCKSASAQVQSTDAITVGIEGHFRVGCWTGIHGESDQPEILQVVTEDGDGVTVAYVQPTSRPKGSSWSYAIPGSEEAPLGIEFSDGQRITTRFPTLGSPSRGPSQVPLGMPWVISIGDPLGVDQMGANALLRRDATIAVSIPKSAAGLPDSELGYDGVDLIMIGGSGTKLLAAMSPSQRTAMETWMVRGGRVLLMLGKSLPELQQAAPWLLDLIPAAKGTIENDWTTVQIDPSAIETFTATQTPLQPFAGAKLPKGVGDSIINGRTTRRVSTPVAAEYVVGLGKITALAADLDQAPFVDWPQRLDLITQLTGKRLSSEVMPTSALNRSTAYDDLAGQMRATLDHFPTQRRFRFSIVSLILLGLITLVGPLDYFVVNRLLGKPLLGWLTFPAMAIGIAAFLILQANPMTESTTTALGGDAISDSPRIPVNRIEWVDLDSKNQLGRSFAWASIYSHDANLLDITSAAGPSLGQLSKSVSAMLTIPYGFPGRSFGAIQVTGENERLPTYQVSLVSEAGTTSSEIRGVPLAPRSSKSIASQIRFTPNIADDLVMHRRGGSELLEGELENPLPVDLLNGILIYRNWAYLLPTRFPAGGRIESIDSLRQKNFRWQLSRQKALESSTETQAWDAALTDDPERIAEILMFHEVVGGAQYTTLKDQVLTPLDLSHVLTDERCILIGRLASPLTQLATSNHGSTAELAEQTLTLVRIIIPVESKRRY
ncbi:hypothetical protein [Novipirellula artificiosorum]|uniref:DUF4350 domain-containing protein n=1 Tax=Novipirellula artificiosorum TaxID=2528016 RepID=A0A5C6E024_9BACT|nr:hypothetical protein [Novipirellula artificiosorum]TWU42065.1 hypothetical protein Poly41_03610 [Novipirellula artificiosorum]